MFPLMCSSGKDGTNYTLDMGKMYHSGKSLITLFGESGGKGVMILDDGKRMGSLVR